MKLLISMFVLLAPALASAATCTNSSGQSVTMANGQITFQGLDAGGLTSGVKYSIIGSSYVQVPGGPSYAEYSGAWEASRSVVRISPVGGTRTTAQVWNGKRAQGKPAFTGPCKESN